MAVPSFKAVRLCASFFAFCIFTTMDQNKPPAALPPTLPNSPTLTPNPAISTYTHRRRT